ncbi:MAG TPA: hypothetical protein VH637_03475 [Streptosporangiaceae bacterium]|jgi:pimeloyl-ACP methyl ester carboxylesterase
MTSTVTQTAGVLALPGARLAYQVTGTGPAVVFVHGFGLDRRMWEAQVRHLSAHWQVVCYDIARRIPGARYHVVSGAGHMTSMEQPAAVNRLLDTFLDQAGLADER